MSREEELNWYSKYNTCPKCNSFVDIKGYHERDSTWDKHTCSNTDCDFKCVEMELWDRQ
jgi:hypothetical protein